MRLTIKRCTLLEDTYKQKDNEKKEFIRLTKEYVSLLKKLTNNTIDDSEYYELLSKFYNIRFEREDYLAAFSYLNDKKYTSFTKLNTDMVIYEQTKDGFGNGIIYSETKQKVRFVVAKANDVKIDLDKEYTKEEIRKMITNKEIVLVSEEEYNLSVLPEKYETYELFPLTDIDDKECEFVKENVSIFGRILREQISQEKVLNDIKRFMEELNYQLETVTIYNKGDHFRTNITLRDWWIDSPTKEEYDDIQREVTNRK